MANTCADCKYHRCTSQCVKPKKGCTGWCDKKKSLKKCHGSTCKSFVLDDFFRGVIYD